MIFNYYIIIEYMSLKLHKIYIYFYNIVNIFLNNVLKFAKKYSINFMSHCRLTWQIHIKINTISVRESKYIQIM